MFRKNQLDYIELLMFGNRVLEAQLELGRTTTQFIYRESSWRAFR